MSEQKNDNKSAPFAHLGKHLQQLREGRSETLAEVSGAVEIDIEQLTMYELGKARPSEDILLLLISHFATQEDEAMKLWELAGYSDEKQTSLPNEIIVDAQNTVMVMPADARIAYTDMVHVMVNNYGVVLNFMQGAGPNNQPLAVARLGMSKEHAKSVLEVLKRTLEKSEPKSLPPSTRKNES